MEVPAQGAGAQQLQVASAAPLQAGGRVVNANAVDAVPAQTPGFLRDQKFEPSPLDELAKLNLTEDE